MAGHKTIWTKNKKLCRICPQFVRLQLLRVQVRNEVWAGDSWEKSRRKLPRKMHLLHSHFQVTLALVQGNRLSSLSPQQTYVMFYHMAERLAHFAKHDFLRFNRNIYIYSTSHAILTIVCRSLKGLQTYIMFSHMVVRPTPFQAYRHILRFNRNFYIYSTLHAISSIVSRTL